MDEIKKQRQILIDSWDAYVLAERKYNELLNAFQNKCLEHVWIRDETRYDPCRTMYICEKCKKQR